MVKFLLRSGDRFAIACGMIVPDAELGNPQIAERIWHAINMAFHDPSAMPNCPSDRYPIYSIFLLEKVLARTTGGTIRSGIEETIGRLRLRLPE
jgi:hypothetical protein